MVNTIVAGVGTAPRATRLSLCGLAVGVLGLLIQWIADPAKFPSFPPGIAFIVACGALVVLTARYRWAPVFAVLISLWIVLGGWAAGQLTPNFAAPNPGTVTGNVVMTLGLLFAAVTGIVAMLTARPARPR